MSHRLYASDAERQRAYRERQKASGPALLRAAPPTRAPAEPSRAARIGLLGAAARKLSAEYQNWLDRLPGNLKDREVAAHLEEVISQLDEVSSILEAIEPPTVGRSAAPR